MFWFCHYSYSCFNFFHILVCCLCGVVLTYVSLHVKLLFCLRVAPWLVRLLGLLPSSIGVVHLCCGLVASDRSSFMCGCVWAHYCTRWQWWWMRQERKKKKHPPEEEKPKEIDTKEVIHSPTQWSLLVDLWLMVFLSFVLDLWPLQEVVMFKICVHWDERVVGIRQRIREIKGVVLF